MQENYYTKLHEDKKTLVLMSLLLVSVATATQSQAATTSNSAISVDQTKKANSNAKSNSEEQMVVTALPSTNGDRLTAGETMLSKMPLKPRQIPQSVSVIDKERIQQQDMKTLNDALAQSTGVTTVPDMHYTSAFYVRGTRVNSIELDGLPQLLGADGTMPQDLAAYDRIEILRGSNGLMNGLGNPSATVNMVRKRASHDFMADINLQAGSWNNYRGQLDVGGPLNEGETIRGRAVVAWSDGDYFYDRASNKTRVAYGTLEADLTPETLLRLGAEYQSNVGNPSLGSVPMASDGSDLHLSRKTNMDAPWGSLNYYTTRLFMALEHNLNENWQSKFNVDYQSATTNTRYGIYYGNVDKTTGDGGGLAFTGASSFNNNQLSFDTNLTGKVQAFGLEHQLIIGSSYTNAHINRYDAKYEGRFYLPINVYHFDVAHISEPTLGDYKESKAAKENNKSLYALGRIKLAEPLTLVVGGRENWYQQSSLKYSKNSTANFTPYGGLIWDFVQDWSLYASYASVYQPQSNQTYSGSLLDPLEGKTYETGIKTSQLNGALNLSMALFRMDMDNSPIIDSAHIGRTAYYINGGKASSKGIELEASGYLTPYWSVFTGYSYSKTEQGKGLSNSGSSYNDAAPRNILRAWTNYDLPWDQRRWSIGGGMQAQSHFGSIYDSALRQGGYAIFNGRVGYHITDDWTASVNINNIFDRHYYQGLFMRGYSNRYGDPRNVTLTLNGHF